MSINITLIMSVTLSENEINMPIKRQTATWGDLTVLLTRKPHKKDNDNILKVKGQKSIHRANRNQKKAGMAISDIVDFLPGIKTLYIYHRIGGQSFNIYIDVFV